jgi:hypothetical protein
VGHPAGAEPVRGALHGAEVDPAVHLSGELRGEDCVAGQRHPAGPLLPGELAYGQPGLIQRLSMVTFEGGRPGQQQPRLGQCDLPLLLPQRAYGLRRRLSRFRNQADGQQQLAAVGEQQAQPGSKVAQPAFDEVEVVERARHVATERADPAEVLLDERERQVQAERAVQLLRLAQVGLGGGELVPLAIQDAPVGQDLLEPLVISGATQYGQRALVARERLLEPAEIMQNDPALRLCPGSFDAVDVPEVLEIPQLAEQGIDLAQRLARATSYVENEGQPQPRRGGKRGRAGSVAERDRGPQMPQGGVGILQVQRGEPQRALGDRYGGHVVLRPRLPGDRGRQRDRPAGIGLCQPQRLQRLIR